MSKTATRGRATRARRCILAALAALADRLADAGDFEGLERLAEALDRHDDRGNALTWPMGWVDTVAVMVAEGRP